MQVVMSLLCVKLYMWMSQFRETSKSKAAAHRKNCVNRQSNWHSGTRGDHPRYNTLGSVAAGIEVLATGNEQREGRGGECRHWPKWRQWTDRWIHQTQQTVVEQPTSSSANRKWWLLERRVADQPCVSDGIRTGCHRSCGPLVIRPHPAGLRGTIYRPEMSQSLITISVLK